MTFTSATAALDAVDNMNLNVLPTAPQRILKVNLARSAKAGAGGRVGGLAPSAGHDEETPGVWGSRKAIWESEDWLREHENRADGDPAEAAQPERQEGA